MSTQGKKKIKFNLSFIQTDVSKLKGSYWCQRAGAKREEEGL